LDIFKGKDFKIKDCINFICGNRGVPINYELI